MNRTILIGTWSHHAVRLAEGGTFITGAEETHPWWQVKGRWFADGASECLVGIAFARDNGIKVGDELHVSAGDDTHWVSLKATGILVSGGAEDNAVLAPLSLVQEFSGHAGKFRQLFVSALTKLEDAFSRRDPKTMTPAEYDRWYCSPYISSISRQIQEVLPGTEVRPIRRVAETEGRVLTRVSALLWLVTLAALAGAGLAVAATAAATVLERRAEIALMKALGATNLLVMAVFLAEQLLLAMVGGSLGFLLGTVLGRALGESVFGIPATFRILLLPVGMALAALVAGAGSLIPLQRAARFQPAPILRGE